VKKLLFFLLAALASSAAQEIDGILRERLQAAQSSSVEGTEGWRFLPAEIKHLLAGDPSKDPKNPLAAIADFNEQLKHLGIRLIVLPVPAKAAVHPEFLDARLKGAGIPMPEAAFYDALRSSGVEVLNIAPDLLAAKPDGPLYCERDTHWNGRSIAIAAKKLAGLLSGVTKESLSLDTREESVEIQGDLGGDKEKVALRFVTLRGRTERVETDRASPILVLGDSHVLVFHDGGDMHASGAGLPDQLAFELGAPVDVLAVRGSGATSARASLARRARAAPDYLASRKVIIWCFGARELTQADAWKLIPLTKPQDSSQ
jgi:hypothetical protein